MRLPPFRQLLPAGLLLCVTSLQAQSTISTRHSDPNDPSVAVPMTKYRSAFDGYRNMRDEPILPWKESNDLVDRIGGWRVYAREAAQGSAPDAGSTPAGSTPAGSTPAGSLPAASPSKQQTAPSVPAAPNAPPGQGSTGAGHGGHK